jgi:hypothetical protein
MNAWLKQHNVSVEDIERVVTERSGFGEVVLHLDDGTGQVDLPVAIVSDRHADVRIDELRIYSSRWPLTGRHANRPPLLKPDPELRESDVVAEYQRSLATGEHSLARPLSLCVTRRAGNHPGRSDRARAPD